MAIAVIGGLVLSTFLSLVVVPAFYIVAERLASKRKRGAPAPPPPAG
jgi:Cu/Ag efflux pump CusA